MKNFLRNIVLIPVHKNIDAIPNYPLFGKREIFCGPKLQNKNWKLIIPYIYIK